MDVSCQQVASGCVASGVGWHRAVVAGLFASVQPEELGAVPTHCLFGAEELSQDRLSRRDGAVTGLPVIAMPLFCAAEVAVISDLFRENVLRTL